MLSPKHNDSVSVQQEELCQGAKNLEIGKILPIREAVKTWLVPWQRLAAKADTQRLFLAPIALQGIAGEFCPCTRPEANT